MNRKFHPWEGGEGKASGQYMISLIQKALPLIQQKPEVAADLLQQALSYPDHLGEGKLEGTKDNHIYYYLGLAMERLGRNKEAAHYYEKATEGAEEPAGAMFYNDQPADMILFKGLAYRKLGDQAAAERRFRSLIDYAGEHLEDQVKIDYFAVSLPDLQIFDEDLNVRNQAHCHFVFGLGYLGMGDEKKAAEGFEKALQLNPHLISARLYLKQQIWE